MANHVIMFKLVKGMTKMDRINKYIDLSLINEYADKDFIDGYSLDIDEIPANEQANFLDLLMHNDTEVRDFVLDHMQKLINSRLTVMEREERFDSCYSSQTDITHGDVTVIKNARSY